MRSRTSPTSRITIRTLRWATTTVACSLRRTPSGDFRRTTLSVQRRSIGLPCPCRQRQLPGKAERTRHKEALELGTLIDPAEAALGDLRDGSRAMRQQPIKGVNGDAHEFRFTLAPALVAPQYAQRPRILALVDRCEDELGERCRIQ